MVATIINFKTYKIVFITETGIMFYVNLKDELILEEGIYTCLDVQNKLLQKSTHLEPQQFDSFKLFSEPLRKLICLSVFTDKIRN